jgi:hypothetical protein
MIRGEGDESIVIEEGEENNLAESRYTENPQL